VYDYNAFVQVGMSHVDDMANETEQLRLGRRRRRPDHDVVALQDAGLQHL